MRRFPVSRTGPKPFTLIFPHIPKTGGTTLLYHFRRHLGDDSIVSYGLNGRMTRFFDDAPQLEELDQAARGRIRVVQGHGVNEAVLSDFADAPVRLIVVLRHPLPLTRSRFNHRHVSVAARGETVTTESFLAADKGNFMSRMLTSRFPSFVDPAAETLVDRAASVLTKFDYVFTTEKMDEQIGGLLTDLDLPTDLERRRVAETKVPLDVPDEEILERNAEDLALFEAANEVASDRGRHNALGFDAAARRAAEERLEQVAAEQSARIEAAYQELAKALCLNLKAEPALEKTFGPDPVAVGDRYRFGGMLSTSWSEHRASLSDRQKEIASGHLMKYRETQRPAEVEAARYRAAYEEIDTRYRTALSDLAQLEAERDRESTKANENLMAYQTVDSRLDAAQAEIARLESALPATAPWYVRLRAAWRN